MILVTFPMLTKASAAALITSNSETLDVCVEMKDVAGAARPANRYKDGGNAEVVAKELRIENTDTPANSNGITNSFCFMLTRPRISLSFLDLMLYKHIPSLYC